MNIKDAIQNRRSIRKFKTKAVPEEHLNDILLAAICAPSSGNLHSRFFYVVRDGTLRAKIARAAYDQQFLAQAPVNIVVCKDLAIKKEYGQKGVETYSVMDCSASIQNMLLLACSLGLGSCWVGAFDDRAVARLVDCPRHLRPVALVAVGYPNECPPVPPQPTVEATCLAK